MRKENRWIRSIAMFALMAATMLFTACNPDEKPDNKDNGNNGQTANVEKKIKEISMTLNGSPQTYSYTWEGNLLTRIEISGPYETGTVTFTYNGGKLSQVLFEDDELWDSYLYTWNGDQIEKELNTYYYYFDSSHTQYTTTNTYTYTNGKITQIQMVDEDDPEPYFCTFLWSGDNMVKYNYDDDFEIVSYEYDDKKNPFHMIQAGFEPSFYYLFPYATAWSANNVTKISSEDMDDTNLSYTYDDDGFPTTMSYITNYGTITCTITYYK